VHPSECVHGTIQYVYEHVTTHPPTRQAKEILDFLERAEEVLEWRPPTVYTMSSTTNTNIVPPIGSGKAAV
jgi:hypothetical protein